MEASKLAWPGMHSAAVKCKNKMRAHDIAQLVECLPGMHKVLYLTSITSTGLGDACLQF